MLVTLCVEKLKLLCNHKFRALMLLFYTQNWTRPTYNKVQTGNPGQFPILLWDEKDITEVPKY